jgi:hypothetical protein
VAFRQPHQQLAAAVEQGVLGHEQCARAMLRDAAEGCGDFAFVAGAHDLDLPLDHAGRVLQLTLLPLGIWIKRIDQPAIDAAAGTSWLKSSRRLASSAEPIRLTPVTLPPAD